MHLPEFFDAAPRISVRDPLARFLGAAEDGVLEYSYADTVKLAGHSCPTVAAAYLMVHAALTALYPDSLPERGGIRVELRDELLQGTTGVVANVVTYLTGATHDTGFKGIGGRFDRRGLLFFGADIEDQMRFTRVDSGAAVGVSVQLDGIPFDPRVRPLMQRSLAGAATAEDARLFGSLWQDRVKALVVDHATDPQVVVVRH